MGERDGKKRVGGENEREKKDGRMEGQGRGKGERINIGGFKISQVLEQCG